MSQLNTNVTVSTVVTPALTRPHHTVPAGWQHADDRGPSVRCLVCGSVGEPSALLNLPANAYGCAGYNLD